MSLTHTYIYSSYHMTSQYTVKGVSMILKLYLQFSLKMCKTLNILITIKYTAATWSFWKVLAGACKHEIVIYFFCCWVKTSTNRLGNQTFNFMHFHDFTKFLFKKKSICYVLNGHQNVQCLMTNYLVCLHCFSMC